jgi:hypothetical protein
MKLPMLVAASALVLSACGGGGARAIAKLECPPTEGDLTRVSTAADGKSCVYRSSDGAEVSLELVALAGDPETTLAGIEKQLLSAGPGSAPVAGDVQAPAVASSDTAAAAAKAHAEALADTADSHQDDSQDRRETAANASDSPKSETTRVDLPGIHIVANEGADGGDNAEIQIGPLRVDANDDDTTVRIFRNVRMRGEAFSREKRGVRATFIYTGKDLPAGYRYVGYQAGGPRTGPLAVATIRTKLGTESGDNINHDVEELVRRNGGV